VNRFTPHITRIVIPTQVLGLVGIGVLIYNQDWVWLWGVFLGWVLISGCGVAVGYHRLLCHNSFKCSTFSRRLLAVLGCLGCEGSPLFWVALHNGYHHSHPDTERDYHSPRFGWASSYLLWQFKLSKTDVSFRAARHLTKDPFIKFLHVHYYKVVWGVVLVMALVSWKMALYGLLIPMFWSLHQEGLVNTFCHLKSWGYRNYETKDNSNNLKLLGLLTWGQALHNNHHAFPNKYNYAMKGLELDPAVPLVHLFKKRSS
tara:strand:+ start:124831 stop:125604 length:774 start_codon:yes stop_codon:yes gene_type:complete